MPLKYAPLNEIIMTVSGLTFFLVISWAVREHFSSKKLPTGMRIVSIASIISICVFINELWSTNLNPVNYIFGTIFHMLSFCVFIAAIQASKMHKISLAFDDVTPSILIKEGIYGYIRHPFYLSYLIFWYGNYLATTSIFCLSAAAIMTIIYVYAILLEEKKFQNSTFSKEYDEYKREVGILFPKVFKNG